MPQSPPTYEASDLASEWALQTIFDVANVTDYVANGSFESLRENVTYRNQPDFAVLVRLVDHNSGWNGDFVYVDKASYDFLRKSALEVGDVVIANVGANAGTVFRVPNLHRPMTLGPNAVLCRPRDEDVLSRDFLYYYLVSDTGQDSVRSILSGSAQPKFNKTDLRRLAVPVPPAAEQRAITRILRTLDDKIELNRRMSETLEAMARVLFKSWFVDFDPVRAKMEGRDPGLPKYLADLFPARLVESELGEIPEGWTAKPLGAWVDALSGGTPSKSDSRYWNGDIPWISPKVMTAVHADEADAYVTEQAIGNGARLAPHGSTLVMVRGMGLHEGVRVSQARRAVTFNQDVKALVGQSIDATLLLFAVLHAQPSLLQRVESSGHGTGKLPSDVLLALPISMPDSATQGYLAEPLRVMNGRIAAARDESVTLAILRSTLLPQLISGNIRVSEKSPQGR
jgi:type I restriction enzyme S subunit